MENWTTCEGTAYDFRPSRRELVGGALAAALVAWAGKSALAQVAIAPKGASVKPLVTIFLRGGMDGLSMIVPTGEDAYHKARPTLRIADAQKLDGFFGLHPALAPLLPHFKDGHLAPIHAIGSLDQSRSHFEAMATMERGAASDPATLSSGWVARYLGALPEGNTSPLRAVAFNTILPDILRGATSATALSSLDQLQLHLPGGASPALRGALEKLYAVGGDDAVAQAGRETFSVLKTLEKLDPKSYKPSGGATYPTSPLGDGLRQTAILLKAGVGLEVACLDRGGWDTHVAQGVAIGYLSQQFKDVGDALAAFATDLGPLRDEVTVVVMTEFGRRVEENSGLGTDHGRASAWLVLGGGVKGGKVYTRWPGCKPEQLEAPGDLKVTTDYRDVLTEIAASRLGKRETALRLFPSAPGSSLGLFG